MPVCTGAGKGEGAGDLGDLPVSFPSPHSVPSPPWFSSSPDFDRNQRGTSLCSDWANGRRRAGAEGRSHRKVGFFKCLLLSCLAEADWECGWAW